jgi:hypothetical protein
MLEKGEQEGLPTIHASYRTVEGYLEVLEQEGCLGPHASEALRPVDALALDVLVSLLSTRPTIVDLAGDFTLGVSTVLARTRRRAEKVITLRSPSHRLPTPWLPILSNYFAGLEPSPLSPCAETLDDATTEEAIRRERGRPTVVLAAAKADTPAGLCRRALRCLDLGRDVIVLVLTLGDTGECEWLDSLSNAFGGNSPYRRALIREQGMGLHDSRLGLIYERDSRHMDNVLPRMREFFTGNASFLSLARTASESAIKVAALEREIARLNEALSSHHARFRLGLVRKVIRALQVYESEGLHGLASRVSRKLGSLAGGLIPGRKAA